MKRLTLLFSIAILLASCDSDGDEGINDNVEIIPDFNISMDPDTPGKLILSNTTENTEGYNFLWNLWLADQQGGTPYFSSSYSRTSSDDENTYFFIQENQWVYIELSIFNNDIEYKTDQYFEVINLPNKVLIDSIQVISVNPTDPDGNSWDGTGDHPDLTVITIPTRNCQGRFDVNWDVDIANDLPVTLVAIDGKDSRDDFSPSMQDFYLYFADVEGHPDIISCQTVSSMGVVRINPYELTHAYNKGNDENYPGVFEDETQSLKANVFFIWSTQ